MTDRVWKAAERAIAKALGGRRVGPTGDSTADVVTPWLSVEVKERKRLPAWLLEAMQQAVDAVQGDLLPIVVWHQLGARHDDDLVVLRLADFRAWFGDAGPPDECCKPRVCNIACNIAEVT